MTLTPEQVVRYESDGYVLPIDIFTKNESADLRKEFEALESQVRGKPEFEAIIRNDSNWVLPFFDNLSRSPAIVDSVASVLGPDVLLLSVDLFVKEPHTPHYVSWHQDLHYWGLDSDDEVTAWLALTPATRESGCMRYSPGSHKTIVEHKDTFSDDNMLTRGQELAVEVDENSAIFAELQPGQMSLHHGRMFHASTANQSNDRRIGIAFRYIKPSMGRATDGAKLGATLVSGEDRFGHFELINSPTTNFEASAIADWKRLRAVEEEILFDGAQKSTSLSA